MEDIPNKLYLEELVDNYNGLTIKLSEGKNSSCLVIHFEVYRSFRSTDEGDLLRTLKEIKNKEVLGTSTLFTVKNSLYVKWFHHQTYDLYQDSEVIHYLIATPNDVIEVLYSGNPTVLWA